MIKEITANTNMTDKEARLYIACLQSGQSTITPIAKQARLNRVSAYSIAEKLIAKGYFTTSRKGKITYFDATNPQDIYESINQRTQKLKQILPDLRRLHKNADHPNIRYFEGIDGVKALYLDSLNSSTEILNYANSEDLRNFWPNYDEEYVLKRANKKIYLRGFAPNDTYGQRVHDTDTTYYRHIKLLPPQKALFHNETNIYDDKISLVSFKDRPMGIIIQNQELADTQRSIFELLWELV